MTLEESAAVSARGAHAWTVLLWCPHGELYATSAEFFRGGGKLEDPCAIADREREDAEAAADVARSSTRRALRKARRAAKRVRPEDFQ